MRGLALPLAAALASCTLPPIDYSGKACPAGSCPSGYRCLALVCVTAGTVFEGRDGGLQIFAAEVSSDADDGTWEGAVERLSTYSDGTVLVGPNNAAGFRFAIRVPPGSEVVDARLQVGRASGDARDGVTLTVRAWDSLNLSPFSADHVHPAELHDGRGFLAVEGTLVPDFVDPRTSSDDLRALVQPLLDRPDYLGQATIGFALTLPPTAPTYASFFDYGLVDAGAIPARLSIQYR